VNKFLLLISIFTIVGCSEDYSKLSFLEEYKIDKMNNRIPAKIGESSCFIDEFGIDRIKSDIKILEKSYTTRVEVPRAYEFASFNAAETHYIKRFNEQMYLGDESTKCDSLPCLLNLAYGDKDGEEGYRIYHWFLTMGSGISTLDKIPGYSRDENRTRVDYLFPNKELKLLNMVSNIISDDYRNILVSTLHRFPNGTSPGLMVAGQFSYSYGSTKIPGTIFFTDQNIRFDQHSNLIAGHYIHTAIHELSHALDFTNGKKAASEHFSGYEDWIQLSWKWGEGKTTKYRTVDGVREEYEAVEMKWIIDEEKAKSEGFVRGYQRTSHKEDFADSGANFIISADRMKKVSPNKLKVISETFYKSKSFLAESELNTAKEYLVEDFAPIFWGQIKECSLDEGSQFKGSSLTFPKSVRLLKSNQKKCIESKVTDHFTNKLEEHRKQQYQGCSIIEKNEKEVLQAAVDSVTQQIESAINQIGGLDEIKASWKILRDNLTQNCSPVTIYLKNRKGSKVTYDKELKECSLGQLRALGESHSIFDDEVESYVDAHPIDIAKKETEDKFILMTKGLESTFNDRTHQNIIACRAFKDEPLQPTTPIDGGVVYVQASVLNCINDNFSKNYDETVQLYLQEKYEISTLALEFITELYLQRYISATNLSIAKISQYEETHYIKYVLENAKTLFSDEINNEKVLIKYFRDKTLDALKTSVENSLIPIFESRGGYPITISSNELSNELVKVLEAEVSINSKAKAKVEIKEVNKYVESKARDIASSDLSQFNWYDDSADFSTICTQNITSVVSEVTYSEEIKYYSQEKIRSDLTASICRELNSRRESDLLKFDKDYMRLQESFVRKNLHSNWEWKFVDNSTTLVNMCFKKINSSDSKFDQSIFIESNALKTKRDNAFCLKVKDSWEKEKVLVSQSINCECAVDKPGDVLTAENWNLFVEGFTSYASSNVGSQLQIALNDAIDSCKSKYPRPRYSLMKMKRKKCLMAINEQNLSDKVDGFKKLKEKIAKELILKLSNEIEDHLK
jgi:hypothetical protein